MVLIFLLHLVIKADDGRGCVARGSLPKALRDRRQSLTVPRGGCVGAKIAKGLEEQPVLKTPLAIGALRPAASERWTINSLKFANSV